MKYSLLLLLGFVLFSCSDEDIPEEEQTTETNAQTETAPVDKKDLVEITGDQYVEYYPDGKTVKFKGTQDANKERHGKWIYLSRDGLELSMTMYKHGKKHGHSIVKYPNGSVHYHGEYKDDKKIGIWKTYNEKGELTSELDYPEEE